MDKIIRENDLPEINMAEIEYAKNISDSKIDTSDIPELTPAQLKAVVAMAKRKREPMPTVAIRIPENVLSRYKALGKGYTAIMSDILTNAVSYL